MSRQHVRTIGTALFVAFGCLGYAVATHATTVKYAAGTLEKIWTVAGEGGSTSSTSMVTLLGTVTKIAIPAGKPELVVATFTAQSACDDVTPGNFCTVAIFAGNTEMNPAAGSNFAFDSAADGGPTGGRAHAIDRSVVLNPGAYRISVKMQTSASTTTLSLSKWQLTIARYAPR